MRDLPTGPTLLGLARDILLNHLLPLLPPEARLDARLVANSMAIAEREAAARHGPEEEIRQALDSLYTGASLTHPALRAGSPLSRIAGEGLNSKWPLSRTAGEGASPGLNPGEAGEGECELLQRFAKDLRAGAFEGSERQARDILWRLTIAKLRLADPRFLAANGFR